MLVSSLSANQTGGVCGYVSWKEISRLMFMVRSFAFCMCKKVEKAKSEFMENEAGLAALFLLLEMVVIF
jgi:hypothetical protein